MRGVIMHAPGDVRVEDRENPTILEPTDAIIRVAASCICGSDLWPYRGTDHPDHLPMGHEYVGVVTQIGDDVRTLEVGDYVVRSFVISDNTCEICLAGYQSSLAFMTPDETEDVGWLGVLMVSGSMFLSFSDWPAPDVSVRVRRRSDTRSHRWV